MEVTPLAGVWIETKYDAEQAEREEVTPLAGVWIETQSNATVEMDLPKSRPSRACGLKLVLPDDHDAAFLVTPLAGVWIETRAVWRHHG